MKRPAMDLNRQAVRWVESVLGGRVEAAQPLVGGVSASIWRVTVSGARGGPRDAVLRRWDGVGQENLSDLVEREVFALEGLAGAGVPVPTLHAADPVGDAAGALSTLTTMLPGEVWLEPSDDWLRALATTLARIHDVSLDADPYDSWLNPDGPSWAGKSGLWARAFEVARDLNGDAQRVFLHRDYQHFNVLWSDSKISGVVDWPSAATGPRGIDVGHCRLNLATLFSADAAERFLAIYETEAGVTVDPRADIAALCSFGPGWPHFLPKQVAGRAPVDGPGMRGRVEAVLDGALRRL